MLPNRARPVVVLAGAIEWMLKIYMVGLALLAWHYILYSAVKE